ncbi:unnamed protein product [Cuscuta epithymum]|uniref:Pectinesterase n=1 Tax=Cuscuta epithymum TaxID=186058 RepID=A0AAV0FDV0_9ASTE|nr:unnamed protein product [Cuscuta epithymum]CAH9139575.1 unnamed protein product [Cuscuta epithymum]
MATSHESLLNSPTGKTKRPSFKALYIFLCLAAVVGSVVALVSVWAVHSKSPSSSLKAQVCDKAHDRSSCLSVVSEVASTDTTAARLLQSVLYSSSRRVRDAVELSTNVNRRVNDRKVQAALEDCIELLDLSSDRLMDSMVALGNLSAAQAHSDAHTWLSSVLTNHETCLDGLQEPARAIMEPILKDLMARASSALAMLVAVAPSKVDDLRPLGGGYPTWVSPRDRRLLEAPAGNVNANVVVAADGSGNYKTVAEAVAAAPDNSKTRYVIYVKKGTYKENVEIGKKKINVMLVGDGMDATIITGSLNVIDGSTTFRSATVAAVGEGFIAQDLCFKNTAGPEKHQAVALRVGADKSVINRCKIDAFQDTLYAHSLRQFYRDCYITGTVDFIFGNAAVVIQNSKVIARKPSANQQNMVTAQGRTDPNQNTGTSIQSCNVIPSTDLKPVLGSIKTFLGRPWKEYSRTVYLQSKIGNHIDPTGWAPWSGDFALNTLYYGEYKNSGPGADTSKRVKWAGYHVITDAAEARKFTVEQLIQGSSWLQDTGVTYTEGL